MTMNDYKYLVSCIEDRDQMPSVHLVGGEPLCHPYFEHLAWEVVSDFPNAVVEVTTNGLLLPDLAVRPIFPWLEFTISEYPGVNDDAVRNLASWSNVNIWPSQGFYNPYRDPGLDVETAMLVREACPHRSVRIVGTRLYNCCVAEGIERYYETERVHVEFDKNWQLAWSELPTWRACQHCFRVYERSDLASICNRASLERC